MRLRDIMTTEVYCAEPSDSAAEVAAAMKRHNVGAMPVCQDGRLLGIVTDRDIVIECVASGANPKECKVSNFMTAEPVFATPDMDVAQAAQLMGKEQVHRLPVVENGHLVGMVSLGDLAVHSKDERLVAEMLKEVSLPVRSIKLEALAA